MLSEGAVVRQDGPETFRSVSVYVAFTCVKVLSVREKEPAAAKGDGGQLIQRRKKVFGTASIASLRREDKSASGEGLNRCTLLWVQWRQAQREGQTVNVHRIGSSSRGPPPPPPDTRPPNHIPVDVKDRARDTKKKSQKNKQTAKTQCVPSQD